MVVRCYELMQGQALVQRGHNGRLSVPPSLIVVLDTSCFIFKSDEASTLGSSQSNNNSMNKNDEASTPVSKRRKLSMPPI
jgi:cyclin D1/2/4, plant